VNRDSLGGPLIVAALMLGIAILGGSYFLSRSLARGSESLGQLTAALGEMKVGAGAVAAPTAAQQPDRARPDSNKRYDVVVGSAPVKGGANAPVTIVEWSDFQCPYCKRVEPTLTKIAADYGDQVSIAFKHLPLSFHDKAQAAHQAAEAAHRQGKFWQMHDRIFGNQRAMSPAKYLEYAKEIGLDVDQFEKDLTSDAVKARISEDKAQAAKLGVTGTPGFFINGRFLSGAQPFDRFKRVIDEELKKES
jgi:protein-disulfide isomerase